MDTGDTGHISEQLEPYARGRLQGERRRAVEEHLAGCPACSAELAAVRALIEPTAPLEEAERARLHAGVGAAISSDRGVRVLPRRRETRLGTVLGAAAAIALVATGVAYIALGPDGGGENALEGAQRAEEPTDVDAEEAVPLRPEGRRADALTEDAAAGAAGGGGTADESRPRWVPLFDPSKGNYSNADLSRLGRTRHPFTTFAANYSVDDIDELQLAFLDALAERFPDPPGEEAVRRCAVQVMDVAADSALPAYGRYGKLHGRMTLLLGFTWARNEAGALDRYMFWAWPRGSCEAPPRYQSGRIRS